MRRYILLHEASEIDGTLLDTADAHFEHDGGGQSEDCFLPAQIHLHDVEGVPAASKPISLFQF